MASEVINAVLSAEKKPQPIPMRSPPKNATCSKPKPTKKARSIQREMKDEALAKAKEIKARAEAEAAKIAGRKPQKNAAAEAARLKADALGKERRRGQKLFYPVSSDSGNNQLIFNDRRCFLGKTQNEVSRNRCTARAKQGDSRYAPAPLGHRASLA